LPHAEFLYNNSVNRSTSKSPFEIVHGFSSCQPIDPLPLPTDYRSSDYAQPFAEHIHNLHDVIRQKLILSILINLLLMHT